MFKKLFLIGLVGLVFAVVCNADVSPEAKDALLSIGGPGLEITLDEQCDGTYEQGQPMLISVIASQEAYLYLFDFDANPDTVSQFFPHPFWDTEGVLQAGVALALPPEGAGIELVASSKPGEGLILGIVVSHPINPALVFTTEDMGGWWEIESPGAEETLAKGLSGLLADLPSDSWYATAICEYTVVAPADAQ